MKAVRFHKTGGPDVLVYEDVDDPMPAAGEVLIRVEAAGLNFADVMRRRGDAYPEPSPPPFILGAEVAGTIAAVGEGVDWYNIGDAVFATPGAGGYAQYVTAPAITTIPLPPGLSTQQAAALVGQGLTAAFALRNAARLQEGETVLVEAAAGGVGQFAVQLAKIYGAGKVIAAASTPEKRSLAEGLGADSSVDYTAPGWSKKVRDLTDGRGVDVVLETVGGQVTIEALDSMADFGRMVFIGQSSGQSATIDPWRLTATSQSLIGFYVGAFVANPELTVSTLMELIGYVTGGQLQLEPGTVLPLSEAAQAHRLLEGRKTVGKVLLEPWSE